MDLILISLSTQIRTTAPWTMRLSQKTQKTCDGDEEVSQRKPSTLNEMGRRKSAGHARDRQIALRDGLSRDVSVDVHVDVPVCADIPFRLMKGWPVQL